MKRLLVVLLAAALLMTGFALAETVKVACVGDSLTYGVIPNTAGKQTEHPYPATLAELLGAGYEVQNFGKPGSSLTEKGVCYRNRDGYQLSLDAAADVYIIMLGTNDANRKIEWDAALFESDLVDMVDAYRAVNADARIVLMAPPAVFPDESTGETAMDDALLRGELREIVAKVAGEKQADYVDLYAATEGHAEWYGGDGIHLLDEGYIEIGHIVNDVIHPQGE